MAKTDNISAKRLWNTSVYSVLVLAFSIYLDFGRWPYLVQGLQIRIMQPKKLQEQRSQMTLMSVSKYVGSPAQVDRRDVARDVAGTVRGLEEHI